jgi:allophanate hydrolase
MEMVPSPIASEQSQASAPHADAGSAPAWILRLDDPRRGLDGGALAGLTFAVKDNLDVAGVATTAACEAFAYRPPADAEPVRRLLEAGASLLGKTNLDQFACGLSGSRSPWGAVPNAFNPAYVSGGSSSGSAYVVATGQVDFALGTDTAGSGRVPAGLNNIVGLKPSRGLISTRGVVPAVAGLDCVSIFARSVDLAARVLQAAAGFDPLDPFSRRLTMAARPLPSRLRFGVPTTLDFFGDHAAEAAWHDAVARMRMLGGEAVVVDYEPLAQAAALLYESALVTGRYAAIRTFFDSHERDVIEPVRSIIGKGRDYRAIDLWEAQVELQRLAQQATTMWDRIDVLMVPTAPTHYTLAQMKSDPVAFNRNLGAYTNFVNLLDYAALAVPSAIRPDGLPFGITLIARCGSDWQLAELGQRYHQATGLTQGATGQALEAPGVIPNVGPATSVRVAVVGAHLSGMPLNRQLTSRGARLLAQTETAPTYRLFSLPDTVPAKPGLLRVDAGSGAAIAVEVWEMPVTDYGSFVAEIPSPLCIGTLELADGSRVQGFLCEPGALAKAEDITRFGGWRAWLAAAGDKRP